MTNDEPLTDGSEAWAQSLALPYKLHIFDLKAKEKTYFEYDKIKDAYAMISVFLDRELTREEYTLLNTSGMIMINEDKTPVAKDITSGGDHMIMLTWNGETLINGVVFTTAMMRGTLGNG